MKVKVLINAVEDRETGKTYLRGTTLELPDERAIIAIAHGYVEEVKDEQRTRPTRTTGTRKVSVKDNN